MFKKQQSKQAYLLMTIILLLTFALSYHPLGWATPLGKVDHQVSDSIRPSPTLTIANTPQAQFSRLEESLPKEIKTLLRAYPEHLKTATADTKNSGQLLWHHGAPSTWQLPKRFYDLKTWSKLGTEEQKTLWRGQDFETVLNQASLAEQLLQIYPKDAPLPQELPLNFEPGRLRDEAFFKRIYGSSRKKVAQYIRHIYWGKQKLKVTTLYQIDRRLEAIYQELTQLPKRYRKYYEPSAGAFHWRTIKGTKRLSVHSFGAAIDIGVKYSNYWKWTLKVYGRDKQGHIPYKNKFPEEIIRIFERYGFIWGGWWYHHDSMHFEFRPELLLD